MIGQPGRIVRVNLSTGQQTLVAQGSQLMDPTDVAIGQQVTSKSAGKHAKHSAAASKKKKGKRKNRSGREIVYFSDRAAFDHYSAIFSVAAPNTNPLTSFTGEPLDAANGIAFDSSGAHLFEVNEVLEAPSVNFIDVKTGAAQLLSSGGALARPFGIAVDLGRTIATPTVVKPPALPQLFSKISGGIVGRLSPLSIVQLEVPGLLPGTKVIAQCRHGCTRTKASAKAGGDNRVTLAFGDSLHIDPNGTLIRLIAAKKGFLGRFKDFNVRVDVNQPSIGIDGFAQGCLTDNHLAVNRSTRAKSCGKVVKPKKGKKHRHR